MWSYPYILSFIVSAVFIVERIYMLVIIINTHKLCAKEERFLGCEKQKQNKHEKKKIKTKQKTYKERNKKEKKPKQTNKQQKLQVVNTTSLD